MKNILSIGIFAVTSLFCASLAASNSNLNFASYTVMSDTNDTNSIIIPNVFSPNRDGINDLFKPVGNFTKLAVKIFNRYGELIYISTQLNEGWNGRTTAGSECSEGTYFYIIETDNETHTGSLTLFR